MMWTTLEQYMVFTKHIVKRYCFVKNEYSTDQIEIVEFPFLRQQKSLRRMNIIA